MKKVCSNLWFLWKLCFKTAPGFMLYHLYDGFRLQIMIFIEHTLCIQYVLKCAEYGEPFWKALLVVGGFLLLQMLVVIPDGYYQHAMVYRAKPKLYKALKEQMYEKAAELDLSCYDNPKYYNEFVLAVSESEASIDRFLTFLHNTVQNVTILISTGVFFIMTDAVGILFVAVSFVASFFLAKKLNKLNYDVRMKVNPWERKRNYAVGAFRGTDRKDIRNGFRYLFRARLRR